jgi:hypothetical protein
MVTTAFDLFRLVCAHLERFLLLAGPFIGSVVKDAPVDV